MRLRLPFFVSFVVGLIWWEHERALRRVWASKSKRDTRNLVVASAAGVVVQILEAPVASALIRLTETRQRGLSFWVPRPARTVAAIILLDYTLYLWHRMTHQVPLLWRFHQVHHLDEEMDASTAVRFHFGEIAMSVAFRAAQVLLIGPSHNAYEAWQTFLLVCILFHHANIRLPLSAERFLAHVIVTPRLHGIHHSIAAAEVNSNWSSGLTVWDWLHGTLRTEVPQRAITIGVPGLSGPGNQQLRRLFSLPLQGAVEIIPMQQHVRQSLLHLEA